jgi:hypothetical protein
MTHMLPQIPWSVEQTRASRSSRCWTLKAHIYFIISKQDAHVCVRDTWTELPLPADIIKRINKLAAGQRKKLRVQPTFAYDPVDEHNNFLEHIDDNELFVNDPADTSTDSSSESDDSDEEDGNNDNTREIITEEIIENERIRQEI